MDRNPDINCNRCRYFFITWEPSTPYGCRAMGFKSQQIPSTVVYRHSGKPCRSFRQKRTKTVQK